MSSPLRTLKLSLLALGLLHLAWLVAQNWAQLPGISGFLFDNGTPVGGDFINLWSAARLALAERLGDLYRPDAFMAYQVDLIGAPIGHRLWAYPPHSLLFAWPFGLIPYYPALILWSALGLVVLYLGSRRCGFDRIEAAVLLASPASAMCLYFGQSGNLATGLLLLALSVRPGRDVPPVIAAALLTIKPQIGFLLPVLWLLQRRWWAIFLAGALTLTLCGLALAIFGVEAWRDYLGQTLPELSLLEREGTGPFMFMIPSAFMTFRILLGDGDLALWLHAVFAIVVGGVLLMRLRRPIAPDRAAALLLLATVLMTPYLHNYDLTLLLAGALLVVRRWPAVDGRSLFVNGLVALVWALPQLVLALNLHGVPLSPLLILPLLLLA